MAAQRGVGSRSIEPAVARIPVEIWKNIIAWAIYPGPIVPSIDDGLIANVNVFAEECMIVSSHRACEVTKSRLRLVCKSWNGCLSEMRPSLVCVPYYDHDPMEWPKEGDLMSAKCINFVVRPFTCVCDDPCRLSAAWRLKMRHKMSNGRFRGAEKIISMLEEHKPLPTFAIRESPFSLQRYQGVFPNLRIAALSDLNQGLDSLSAVITDGFKNLTHLEIGSITPMTIPSGLDIPSITTLVLRNRMRNWSFWGSKRTWVLPSLQYLQVKGTFDSGFIMSHIESLLESTGQTLRGLVVIQDLLDDAPNGFEFPDNIWQLCPRLEYIGGAACSLVHLPQPPSTVPIRVIYISGIFGIDRRPELPRDKVRETPEIIASISRWAQTKTHSLHFQFRWSWERFLVRYHTKPMNHRAEWVNFMIQFGLLGKRHGAPVMDVDGIRFDGDAAFFVQQQMHMDAALLAESLRTTSWTNKLTNTAHLQM